MGIYVCESVCMYYNLKSLETQSFQYFAFSNHSSQNKKALVFVFSRITCFLAIKLNKAREQYHIKIYSIWNIRDDLRYFTCFNKTLILVISNT